MQTRQLAVLVILLGLVGTGCQSPGDAAGNGDGQAGMDSGVPQPVPILRQMAGDAPALAAPGLTWVKSQAELDELRSPELAEIGVDFSRESLLVLTLGEQSTGGYWARITGVQKSGNDLYVQGLANAPAQDQAVTQAITHPCAVAVVPVVAGDGKAIAEITSVVGQDPPDGG